jgi:hypothetical protein
VQVDGDREMICFRKIQKRHVRDSDERVPMWAIKDPVFSVTGLANIVEKLTFWQVSQSDVGLSEPGVLVYLYFCS